MRYSEYYEIFCPIEKRNKERSNPLLSYFYRPLAVLVSIPVSKTKLQPTTITMISCVFAVAGFVACSFLASPAFKVVGGLLYFLWLIFDCVDGNVARYKNQCSERGELWDAFGGYLTMVLMYFSAGIASYAGGIFDVEFDRAIFLGLGSATAILSIFPRLMLQKKKNTSGEDSEVVARLNDKTTFGGIRAVGQTLLSAAGLMMLAFLAASVFNAYDLFIVAYFILNGLMSTVSLILILK